MEVVCVIVMQTNGATYPGSVRVTFGGVGRNLADALSRLQCTPLFLSAVGVDMYARMFMSEHTYMVRHHQIITKLAYVCYVLF